MEMKKIERMERKRRKEEGGRGGRKGRAGKETARRRERGVGERRVGKNSLRRGKARKKTHLLSVTS
jgi:hypothetical protein